MDQLAEMRAVVLAIDTGSFSAAARRLRVGQPAVSKTIAQLEHRLGVLLLTRSTRGLTPTDAGLRYCERAREALRHAEEAERVARGQEAALTGALRVAAPATFGRLHIVPRLAGFLSAHPDLEIDLLLDDAVIDLVEHGVDVAVRTGDLADSAATARRLGHGARAVVATQRYLDRAGAPESPGDLAGHSAIVYSQQRARRWIFARDGREVPVSVGGRLRMSSAEGIRAAVLADLGLTVASRWMFAPELADGSVRALLPDWTLPPVDLWAVYPGGPLATRKARAFIAFLADALASPEPMLPLR